jgi:sporulation protein YlmC with PRC-barrel domain
MKVMRAQLLILLLVGSPAAALSSVQDLPPVNATALVDRAIEDDDGDFPGWIREVVLDPTSGTVRFLVVELGAPARRTIAVPWSYLSIRQDGTISWRASNEEIRRARPYASSERGTTTEPDGGMVSYAPTEDNVNRFDPAKTTTYRGVVVGTMSGSFGDETEEVMAVVDLGQGRTIRARLGPELYLTQIGLSLSPGQSVVLQGFSLESDEDQPIVVLSELTIQGKSYRLRNLDGTPFWTRMRTSSP